MLIIDLFLFAKTSFLVPFLAESVLILVRQRDKNELAYQVHTMSLESVVMNINPHY
jgi:hypothetical protein